MGHGVEHGWHVETMMHLARCSMLMGETQAAKKILYQLRHTLFYDQWADGMLQLIDHPQQMAQHPETGPVMRMLHYKNSVGADGGDVERYVMNVLAAQDADDPYFQEQAVLATLWLRDAKRFWPRFFHYARLKGQMPRIFQEAAYLFGKVEGRADIDKMPFDKSVKDSYAAFMKETDASRTSSHDFRYQNGNYMYHDTYVGGEKFAGEEAIWKNSVPVYAMNYMGRVIADGFSGNFLKEALRAADEKMPYRGPEHYQSGEYTYRCNVTGDFTWFQGYEEIYQGDVKVYECVFHGGLMK